MSNLNITGYGDDLTINGVRIGDLSPQDHENIEKEKGGQNYKPLENVVVSHVKDSSTLICRKPSLNEIAPYVEEELLPNNCLLRNILIGKCPIAPELTWKIFFLFIKTSFINKSIYRIFFNKMVKFLIKINNLIFIFFIMIYQSQNIKIKIILKKRKLLIKLKIMIK